MSGVVIVPESSSEAALPGGGVRRSACPMHALFARRDPAAGAPGAGRITAGGVAVFAYGLAAYAAFFATIVYAIGFVSNMLAPKTIDSGPAAPLGEALLVNGSILGLFVAQHTVMARAWFKRWVTRFIPASIERSTYVMLASAVLGLLFWQWRPLPQVVWSIEQPVVAVALQALSLCGWAIVFLSSFMVNHFDLFGLRQSYFGLKNSAYRPVGFRLVGFYKLVRHPLMVGFLIAFWATPTMTVGHLFFAIMTTGYIFFGTWIEERDLMREHGDEYRAYRARVRGFVPLPRAGLQTQRP